MLMHSSSARAHIWGLVEGNCGAYFHAATSLLNKISLVQRGFSSKLAVREKEAFLSFNFAPTQLRRDIAILGLLHKRVLGQCHPAFERLLPYWSERFETPRSIGHDKPLYGHWADAAHHRSLHDQSIFSMIDTYNNLPQNVVDLPSVSFFQKALTDQARERCRADDPLWSFSFSSRSDASV